jgi:uncharacterized membrane protein YtjA (UPF0391 family)
LTVSAAFSAEKAATFTPAQHALWHMDYGPRQDARGIERNAAMLHYALVFLVIAVIAALLGFTGIAGTAAWIAKVLFVLFLILAVIAFFRRAS